MTGADNPDRPYKPCKTLRKWMKEKDEKIQRKIREVKIPEGKKSEDGIIEYKLTSQVEPNSRPIDFIIYKNGEIAFSTDFGETFIYLYKDQKEIVKKILNQRQKKFENYTKGEPQEGLVTGASVQKAREEILKDYIHEDDEP
jgi:hypothetical protein